MLKFRWNRGSLCRSSVAAVMVAAFSAGATQAQESAPERKGCEEMIDMVIGVGKIAIPTNGASVTSARLVPATERTVAENGQVRLGLPEYCEVRGSISPIDPAAPDINFQVSLPSDWNGNALQYGGGGTNGNLVTGLSQRYPQPLDSDTPITRGFATFGGDSGHSNDGGDFTSEFALNEESLRNFGYESIKKTKDVAFEIIQAFYGERPGKSFFAGHSNGGREALVAVQRYPYDYDGVLSATPVLNWVALQLAGNAVVSAFSDGGWINTEKIALLSESTLAACDSNDGIEDGVIGNYLSCEHDLTQLRCAGGEDTGNDCLSDQQITAVRLYRSPTTLPFELANGVTGFEGFGLSGRESAADGWSVWVTARGATAHPQQPGQARLYGQGNVSLFGQMFVRYFVVQDPAFDTYNFDVTPYEERIKKVSAILDATAPDISEFIDRGGKLILTDNTGDSAQSGFSGIAYYDAMLKAMGDAKTREGVRFYVSPGASHYGIGLPTKFDVLTELENWVVQGREPSQELVAVQMDPVTFEKSATRPVCEYPTYPHYSGSGEVGSAASFSCKPAM